MLMPFFKKSNLTTSSFLLESYSLVHTVLHFPASLRKLISYGEGLIRSPKTTCPRFSAGADLSTGAWQKSKLWWKWNIAIKLSAVWLKLSKCRYKCHLSKKKKVFMANLNVVMEHSVEITKFYFHLENNSWN